MKKLIILRRLSQTFFLFLFIYILWSTTYPLKGFISPQILFKLDPLIMLVTAMSERVLLPGLVFSLVMVVMTLILGRFFCGWVCPLGSLIDFFGAWRKKKRRLPDIMNAKIRKTKYVILAIIVFFAVGGIQGAWLLDPIVLVARVVSLNIIPAFTLLIDHVFIFVIKKFELYGPVYDVYRELKATLLGVNVHFFVNSLITFIVFVVICGLGLWISRAWCRLLCPLGGLYAALARFSLLQRKTENCTHCRICHQHCRMGAIKEDGSYSQEECILCMDCIYDCRAGETEFSFEHEDNSQPRDREVHSSRREFLLWLLASIPLLGFRHERKVVFNDGANVIRPPGALREDEFCNTCVRCGNCMKVCITNGLQPAMFQNGIKGLWTPRLVPEIGYCEYQCTLCGQVCPTGAITALAVEGKKQAKLGVARIDRSLCIAWADNKQCIVCEEHCPVADKAIKVKEEVVHGRKVYKPFVDESLCIGCGICQNKCPVRPVRAIQVDPAQANRVTTLHS